MKKKIISVVLSLFMLLVPTATVFAEDAEQTGEFDGYVYFTVERNTLGQGFALEPVKVGYYDGETLAHISQRALGDMSTYQGDISKYYLTGVVDGGEPENWSASDVPEDILNALGGEDYVDEREEDNVLSAEDYSAYGGWMFTVDNLSINTYAYGVEFGEDTSDGLHYNNGSVVRLQFTLYGWGEDIGCGWGYMPMETSNTFADRSELIKKVADIKADGNEKIYGEDYTNALNLLGQWNITESEIDDAVKSLSHNYTFTSNSDGTHTRSCTDDECDATVIQQCDFEKGVCSLCNCKVETGYYGDVNSDGVVNIKDATKIQKYLVNLVDLSDAEIFYATIDDTVLDINTVTRIQKYVANYELTTNIGELAYRYY